LVRTSFGCYNQTADIDRLVEMLERITHGDYQGNYLEDPRTGSYLPVGPDLSTNHKPYFDFRSH
jgi:hypothetical protein